VYQNRVEFAVLIFSCVVPGLRYRESGKLHKRQSGLRALLALGYQSPKLSPVIASNMASLQETDYPVL
jgi:hypothetical protein